MKAREDLQKEIVRLALIIETNQAALRLSTVSAVDKVRLVLALDQRKARRAALQEQLAALPDSN
jgi:hypothetical protein